MSAGPQIVPSAARPPVMSVSLVEAGAPDPAADRLLAELSFGEASTRRFSVPLRQHGPRALVERWHAPEPVVDRGARDGLRYTASASLLAGQLVIDQDGRPARDVAHEAYRRIVAFLREAPHRHLLRVWNFIASINAGEGDLERYRQFCIGRYEALAEAGQAKQFPAATAIGSHGGPMVVQFIAGIRPGRPLENPRQIEAWRYPREYGPRSPSFSRATLLEREQRLLVSGTASVVGHRTLHPGRLLPQLEETARNLEILRGAAACHGQPQALRAYVRHAADIPQLQAAVDAYPVLRAPTVFLHGDICRADLVLEVEGVF